MAVVAVAVAGVVAVAAAAVDAADLHYLILEPLPVDHNWGHQLTWAH